ncbi:MAG: hypothetical protein K6G11_09635 [Lachnospiraceae bacterium]|nr:hypothetical protein [Lachnospiraceae bacterium]
MIKCERTEVMNINNAIRGARNPLNSWDRSDSYVDSDGTFKLGEKDLDLAKRLCTAGNDHRKFIRQIFISVDITAPIYWWKEYDTYKVGTVANSTSTMHKIHSKPFELNDFSHDHLSEEGLKALEDLIKVLEDVRLKYVETKDKTLWYTLIQLLPEGYHQMRTCTFSYENAIAMFRARKNHKLQEWHDFCLWIKGLPYMQDLFEDVKEYEG